MIYIYIDSKSNMEDFDEYKDKVLYMNNDVDIRWGSYALTEVMVNGIKKIIKKNYDYISFISGDCLPIKNDIEIKKFLSQNKGMEFIGIKNNINQNEINKRVEYCYPKIYFKKNKNIIERILIRIINKFKILKKNKYFSKLPTIYKGCNWFTITGELANYIVSYLQDNIDYERAFYKSFISDEIFFHTIVMNSSYKYNVFNEYEDDNLNSLRYIDWNSGPDYPKILDEEDMSLILESNCLFARKFSENLNIEEYKRLLNI